MSEKLYTVTCTSCHAGNRVPASREGEHGRCGSCHEPLPVLHVQPVALGEAAFQSFLHSTPLPVLAEFWAPW